MKPKPKPKPKAKCKQEGKRGKKPPAASGDVGFDNEKAGDPKPVGGGDDDGDDTELPKAGLARLLAELEG